MKEYIKECVNSHDLCYTCYNDCPYCEYKLPLRTLDGKFAKIEDKTKQLKGNNL